MNGSESPTDPTEEKVIVEIRAGEVEPRHPVAVSERSQSLDVLRGFALLGILLLNILGFGLHTAGYFNPLIALGETETSRLLNLGTWGSVNVKNFSKLQVVRGVG